MNLINGFNSRLDKPEERVCALKDKSELISRIKHTETKELKHWGKSMRDLAQ